MSAATPRAAGCAFGEALNFRAVSGACDRISVRPRMPGRTGRRCQMVRDRASSRASMAAPIITRFAMTRCSKHCATLHREPSGCQFSGRASKLPNVGCASRATSSSPCLTSASDKWCNPSGQPTFTFVPHSNGRAPARVEGAPAPLGAGDSEVHDRSPGHAPWSDRPLEAPPEARLTGLPTGLPEHGACHGDPHRSAGRLGTPHVPPREPARLPPDATAAPPPCRPSPAPPSP